MPRPDNKKSSSAVFLSSSNRRPRPKSAETKPEKRDITETVFASGIVEPENKYNLTAQTDGYILALNYKENDIVKEGDIIAVVDNKTNG